MVEYHEHYCNRKRNLHASKAPLESQAQGTNLLKRTLRQNSQSRLIKTNIPMKNNQNKHTHVAYPFQTLQLGAKTPQVNRQRSNLSLENPSLSLKKGCFGRYFGRYFISI